MKHLPLLLILAVLQLALAQPARADEALVAQARGLAGDATWLRLGHYVGRERRSDVTSAAFFLAPGGRDDPAAELEATVRAMLAAPTADPDAHAQCRFPARYAFLRQRLDWPADAAPADCPRLRKWRQEGQITGISLIFVSGYLSNPASIYGHLLLKFDTDAAVASQELLDPTLNYGARFPEHENGLLYLTRGLTGGYQSNFTRIEYYNHAHRYAETQLRDIWEYDLDLTQAQVDLLVAHSWELMGAENRYYFLKQNCAYRMAEMIELVTGRPLLARGKAWATPVDVFVRLTETQLNGKPLVREVRRLASPQNRFREGLLELDPNARAQVVRFANDGAGGVAPLLADLPKGEQAQALETLIDYYAFVDVKAKGEDKQARATRDQLLVARMRLPPGAEAAPKAPPPPPHMGQRSSLVQVSAVSDERGGGAELRFRGAYNDFLSFAPGAPKNSELSMLDLRLTVRDGEVDLRSLEMLRIANLNISDTGLPRDGGRAWRLRLAVEPRDLACHDCLMALAEGGLGKGWRLPGETAAYAFLNGQLGAGEIEGTPLRLGPSAGLLFGGPQLWRANLEAGVWQAVGGEGDTRPFARLGVRLGSSPRWDVRAGVEHQRVKGRAATESRLGLSFYW